MRNLERAVAPFRSKLAMAASGISDVTLTAALIIAIGCLAFAGLYEPFDTSLLLSGDAVYPVVMLDVGFFDFRPPPPNRLFPDVAVHWVMSLFSPDALEQKIISGLVLICATLFIIGLFKGRRVFAAATILTISLGFYFVDSAGHYTLPLLVLMYQLAPRHSLTSVVVLALIVFFNLLVLIPLMILLTAPEARPRAAANTIAVGVGFFAAAIYADFGDVGAHQFLWLTLVLPVWLATLLLVDKFNVKMEMCTAVVVVLLIAGFAGISPGRFVVPISTGILIALTPVRPIQFYWRYLAIPAAISAIFLATADYKESQRMVQSYECLAKSLSNMGISNVAADHWSSKLLYLAARKIGVPLTVTQTDFLENRSYLWMAPYSFYGKPTLYSIRSRSSCALRRNHPIYCGQPDVAPVVDEKTLCGDFSLWHYSQPIPAKYYGPARSKLGESAWQLRLYTRRVLDKIFALAQSIHPSTNSSTLTGSPKT